MYHINLNIIEIRVYVYNIQSYLTWFVYIIYKIDLIYCRAAQFLIFKKIYTKIEHYVVYY